LREISDAAKRMSHYIRLNTFLLTLLIMNLEHIPNRLFVFRSIVIQQRIGNYCLWMF